MEAIVELRIMPAAFTLDNKIGEGRCREVFRNGNLAIKLLKSHIEVKKGDISLYVPAELYSLLRFGIFNYNQLELDNYKSFIGVVPEDMRKHFVQIFGLDLFYGRSAVISELVTNHDGSVSKPLKDFGVVKDERFWRELGKLEEMMLDLKILPTDLTSSNILVRENEAGAFPVLPDYKRIGLDINRGLFFRYQQERMLRKTLSAVREEYNCGWQGSNLRRH